MRSSLRHFVSMSPPARPTASSAAGGGVHRLCVLARQLRCYSASSNLSSGDTGSRGKAFSPVAALAAEPAAAAAWRAAAAAVLVCLFEGGSGELRVILTKRSSNLSSHSGEVSLPGGKMEDEDEDEIATALREAKEEIGIDPASINVIAVLEPFRSKHLLSVVPVIGILLNRDSFTPVLNKDEVDDIFDAPLEMFLKDDNHRMVEHREGDSTFILHSFDYEIQNKKFLIWGLTARILIRAASIVYQRQPSFLENPSP